MPWYAWAYLALLCLIGAGGFVAGLRAGRARLAFLYLAAVTVLAWGVALYFRGEGAGIAFGLALLCAIAVLARKSFADTRLAGNGQIAPAGQLGVALGQLLLVPGAVLGVLAFWMQRGG
ncbi:hypothetical protein ACFONC_08175 [Luteimonas soli]|uniref:Uncharacterized protein n=1 Tax=Luteimonas soli TaxID=1648966 RepID=A0ABV7XIW4_9GAMM